MNANVLIEDMDLCPIDLSQGLEDDLSIGSSASFLFSCVEEPETTSAPGLLKPGEPGFDRYVPRMVSYEDLYEDMSTEGKRASANATFQERPAKKRRNLLPLPSPSEEIRDEEGEDTSVPLLHRVCCRPTITAGQIDQLLGKDRLAASRSFNVVVKTTEGKKEPYSYPVNLAIKHGLNKEVVEKLVAAAPSVLMLKDGNSRETTLHVLARYYRQEYKDVFNNILLNSPRSAAVLDRNQDTPLHIACQNNISLGAVRNLCILYPQAVTLVNKQDKTPLELLERSEDVRAIGQVLQNELGWQL